MSAAIDYTKLSDEELKEIVFGANNAPKIQAKHICQIVAMDDRTRHRFVLAGRRGGKTELLKEEIVQDLPTCPKNGEIFYIGPTNQQAKELMWDKLCERLDELGWKYKANSSNQVIRLSRGRKIYIIGAEKIRRIRGHKVYRAYLDEVAFFTVSLREVWRAVRPALSDYRGRAVLATTPNGKGTDAYDFYIDILDKTGLWAYHHWHTLDNPFIDVDEIRAAMWELDEKSFRQEYMATWESFEGLAYYNFDETRHISKTRLSIDLSAPVDMCWDFNVNPTSLLVAQREPRLLLFKREYSFKDSSTERTIQAFCDDLKALCKEQQVEHSAVKIRIFGDSTGAGRSSVTGRSDYHYIQEWLKKYEFEFQMCVPSVNPNVIDRVNWANSWMRNMMGESRMIIDPSCRDLIRDFGSQVLDGRHPSDANNLGHKADAAGYYVSWNHLQETRRPQRTIEL